MPTYKDVDAILRNLPDDLPYKASVKRVLIQSPEADVVEVVRCKDCKYWGIREGNDPNKQYFCNIDNMWCKPTRNADDYCIFGERKD